jgi:hypothetical protein
MDSYLMNLFLKLFFMLLSIYLIFGSLLQERQAKISLSGWLIIGFWSIYSLRLIYDTQVVGLVFRDNVFKFYSIAFGNCLIGAIATIKTAKYIDLYRANKFFFITILLSCLSILATIYFLQGSINPTDIVGRARFRVELGDGQEKDVLNPITISLYGEFLILLALANLAVAKRRTAVKLVLWGAFFLGALVLTLGASRGPLLGTAVGMLFCLGVYLWYSRKTPMFIVKTVLAPILLIGGIYRFILPKLEGIDFTILNRMSNFNEQLASGKKEFRNFQWESAWQQFLENPIIGDRYLERYANFYPHNIYLESLMAMGVVGGLLFMGIIIVTFFVIFRSFYSRQDIIVFAVLVLAVEVAVFTSGSLFGSIDFWVLLAFIGSITKKQRSNFYLQ